MGGPHPIQIVQDDKYIAMLYEQNSWFHVTPIDGRPHREYSTANRGDIAPSAPSTRLRTRRNGCSCGTRFSVEM